MTFEIALSTEAVDIVISRLKELRDNLQTDIDDLVDILAEEGADVARSAYGGWEAYVDVSHGNEDISRVISVTGDMPAIAEFGAGDATLEGGFEETPEEVRRGSYSEEHARQYSRWGFWYFQGEPYTEVPARHGLLDAKRYIIEKSTETAREVIQL